MKRALVGLGNPGKQYTKTRHNAGFMCVEAVAKALGAGEPRAKFGGLLWEVKAEGLDVLLFQPTSFMNLSGKPTRELADFYELTGSNLAVASDDVYIRPGSVRIRQSGSDGGHNGWKSIQEHLPFADYWRVRIGAGIYHQEGEGRLHQPPLEDYVLQRLPASDLLQVEHLIDNLVPNLIRWLKTGELREETHHHQTT